MSTLSILKAMREKCGQPDQNGVCEMKVPYFYGTHSDGKGRRFAAGGRSLQSIPREIRWYIAGHLYVDIDMVNAHPSIMVHLCELAAADGIRCDHLKHYVANRDQLLESLGSEGMDRNAAKKFILENMNGKDNADRVDQEWVRDLSEEMRVFRQYLTVKFKDDFEKRKHIRINVFGKNYNHDGSFFNSVICAEEDRILMEALGAIKSLDLQTRNTPLMFDGLMLPITEYDKRGNVILDHMSYTVRLKTGFEVKFVIKPMERRTREQMFQPVTSGISVGSNQNNPVTQEDDQGAQVEDPINILAWDWVPDLLALHKGDIYRISAQFACVFDPKTGCWSHDEHENCGIVGHWIEEFLHLPHLEQSTPKVAQQAMYILQRSQATPHDPDFIKNQTKKLIGVSHFHAGGEYHWKTKEFRPPGQELLRPFWRLSIRFPFVRSEDQRH